jgi:hypothetical protein
MKAKTADPLHKCERIFCAAWKWTQKNLSKYAYRQQNVKQNQNKKSIQQILRKYDKGQIYGDGKKAYQDQIHEKIKRRLY